MQKHKDASSLELFLVEPIIYLCDQLTLLIIFLPLSNAPFKNDRSCGSQWNLIEFNKELSLLVLHIWQLVCKKHITEHNAEESMR